MLHDLNEFINKKDPKSKPSALAAAPPNATMFDADAVRTQSPVEDKNSLEAGESVNIENHEDEDHLDEPNGM